MTRFYSLFFLGLLLSLSFTPGLFAQENPTPGDLATSRGVPMVKEYGRPGYPKITVYVWGNADTGVWNVEKGTDLLEFVSVVSRAQMSDRSPDRRLIQELSIFRNGRRDNDPFFEAKIEDLFANRTNYPALQEGDILVLETKARNRFTWRDVARVAGTIATMLNTYLLLERVRD